MGAKLALPGTITVTSAGTRVVCSSVPLYVNSVLIQADPTNSGYIYVGDSTVTSSNGVALAAGQSVEVEITVNGKVDEVNLADIYLDSSANGNKGRITVIKRG